MSLTLIHKESQIAEAYQEMSGKASCLLVEINHHIDLSAHPNLDAAVKKWLNDKVVFDAERRYDFDGGTYFITKGGAHD